MLGTKIYELRKKNGLTQEALAEKMDITRQTVSNWENGETAPNPDQLKCLSHLFGISVDCLLENEGFAKDDGFTAKEIKFGFEYKSEGTVRGVPLIHVNIGGGGVPRRAKGIIAIGDIAQGVVAIGGVSLGVVSIGGIGLGAISLGGLALGLITALGGCAIAPIALGGFALGVIACGGGAVGLITNLK